jgi:hypothetical protein
MKNRSVGCIIIELLTGKPPYYDLAPMTALFRIVQDDYPPLPEGVSPALRDFLLLCFKKEPLMRSSAAKLLEHPWLNNSSTASNLVNTSRLLQSKSTVGNVDDGIKNIDREADSIVNTIKLYQNEVETLQHSEETSVNTYMNRSLSDVGSSLELFKLSNKDQRNYNSTSPSKQITKIESKISIKSNENKNSNNNRRSKTSTPDFSDSSTETSDNMVSNRILTSLNALDVPVVKNQSIKFSNAPFVYNENSIGNNQSYKQDDDDDDEIWDDEIIEDERVISASLDELDDEYAISIKTGGKMTSGNIKKLELRSPSFLSPDKSIKSSKKYSLASNNMSQKFSPAVLKSISLDSFSSSFY